jgi:outer membrane protein assembly factor BamB
MTHSNRHFARACLILVAVLVTGLSLGCDRSKGQTKSSNEATQAETLEPPAQKTKIVWKTRAPDLDCSSPTPPHFDAGDSRVIYFDCSVLTAYDRASGEKAWEMKVEGHQDGGPSAVIGDINVYFERKLDMNEYEFYAVDLESGEVNWKMQGAHGWGRPIVQGGKVYLPTWTKVMNEELGKKIRGPMQLVVHDPTSGDETRTYKCGEDKWSLKTEDGCRFAPVATESRAFESTNDHTLIARDLKTGETSYTLKPEKGKLNDLIPLGTTDGIVVAYEEKVASPVRLFGFDPASGEVKWEHDISTDLNVEGPRFDGSHILLLRAVEGANILQAFDAKTGEVDWNLRFESSFRVPKSIDGHFYHRAFVDNVEHIVASKRAK